MADVCGPWEMCVWPQGRGLFHLQLCVDASSPRRDWGREGEGRNKALFHVSMAIKSNLGSGIWEPAIATITLPLLPPSSLPPRPYMY